MHGLAVNLVEVYEIFRAIACSPYETRRDKLTDQAAALPGCRRN